jgi:hypothetical protein
MDLNPMGNGISPWEEFGVSSMCTVFHEVRRVVVYFGRLGRRRLAKECGMNEGVKPAVSGPRGLYRLAFNGFVTDSERWR